MVDLSDTERLIVSYVQSHPPEESMLDKISTGTGKSRATVLKYLEALHAKEILDFKIIGRNKLWMLKQVPLPAGAAPVTVVGTSSQDRVRLTSAARELYDLKVRERELTGAIDRPDSIIAAIDEQMNIIFTNNAFRLRFLNVAELGGLVKPADLAEVKITLLKACNGDTLALDIDLVEGTGIFRAYHLTLAPAVPDKRSAAAIVIGEDMTGQKRSRRDLESLLYIIRTTGQARSEPRLLKDTMNGIRERLLPYMYGAVLLEGGRIAYQSPDMPPGFIDMGKTLVERSLARLETLSAAGEKDTPGHMIALPIISDEKPIGAILLALNSPASATDAENVEIVADEVSSALKSLRLDIEKSEYVNTLLAVNRVSAVLNETKDESTMLERSIASTMDTLGFDMGCVYLRECGSEMAMKVQKNMPESLYTMCLSGKFKSLFDRAIQERRVIHIVDDSPEYAVLDGEIKANGVRTMLVLPIVAGSEIVGLLNMGSRAYKPYTRMSLDNIASIGLQLGLALERTRLAIALEDQANKDLT